MPKVGQKCDLIVNSAWCAIIWEMKGDYSSFPVARGCCDRLELRYTNNQPVCGGLTSCSLLQMNADSELMQKCFSFHFGYWKEWENHCLNLVSKFRCLN